MAGPVFLLRKGRVLTQRSRLRYRLKRLVTARTAGLDSDVLVGLVALSVRIVTLPVVVAFDYVAWPLVRRTLGRGPWWVVELRFHGPDAEFVRVAEATTRDDAARHLAELARTHGADGRHS